MCCLGKNAKAPGGDADDDFPDGNHESSNYRTPRHSAFFGAHGFGRVEGWRPGHDGIIGDNPEIGKENRGELISRASSIC
jgi:hypothetical protein